MMKVKTTRTPPLAGMHRDRRVGKQTNPTFHGSLKTKQGKASPKCKNNIGVCIRYARSIAAVYSALFLLAVCPLLIFRRCLANRPRAREICTRAFPHEGMLGNFQKLPTSRIFKRMWLTRLRLRSHVFFVLHLLFIFITIK